MFAVTLLELSKRLLGLVLDLYVVIHDVPQCFFGILLRLAVLRSWLLKAENGDNVDNGKEALLDTMRNSKLEINEKPSFWTDCVWQSCLLGKVVC